jgi:hypothetical protein
MYVTDYETIYHIYKAGILKICDILPARQQYASEKWIYNI